MKIPIVDAHCHLGYSPIIDNIDEYIKRNKEAGVIAIINNSADFLQSKKTLELAKKYDIVYAAIGIHPIHVNDYIQDHLNFIEEHIKEVVAIGEVGLDYAGIDEETKNNQKKLFEFFIDLAEKYNKPLIVHSRSAAQDVVEILESSNAMPILHFFTGRKWLVKKIIDNGWILSIPTNIVRLKQLQENVELTPISQLLTETDAPWLSPFKEIYPNEPRFISETLKKISEIKNLPLEEVSEKIKENFSLIFNIKI